MLVAVCIITVILLAFISIFSSNGNHYYAGKTAKDRTAFLCLLGYSQDETSQQKATVVLPENFNDVYTRYNQKQQLAGFDLKPYRGESAVLYSYRIIGFANSTNTVATLIVVNGAIVGGDISFESGVCVLPLINKTENLKNLKLNGE